MKRSSMIKYLFILTNCLTINGCSWLATKLDNVETDSRTEYKHSKRLPDLTVPPDLTLDGINNDYTLPEETEPSTLSAFKQQKVNIASIRSLNFADEHWLSVPLSVTDVWSKLHEFWPQQGYTIVLEDVEFGVLETNWNIEQKAKDKIRHMFKVFIEPDGDNPENHLIIVSALYNQKVIDHSGDNWLTIPNDSDKISKIMAKLATKMGVLVDKKRTEKTDKLLIELIEKQGNKPYLLIYKEFPTVWDNFNKTLKKAGYYIAEIDQQNGIYEILYFDYAKQKKGFLSGLIFWKDDEIEPRKYQIHIDDMAPGTTKIFIKNSEEAQLVDKDALAILRTIKKFYTK